VSCHFEDGLEVGLGLLLTAILLLFIGQKLLSRYQRFTVLSARRLGGQNLLVTAL
jgi:hypothetical protein